VRQAAAGGTHPGVVSGARAAQEQASGENRTVSHVCVALRFCVIHRAPAAALTWPGGGV
jgi:hypothetical protein